MEKKYSKKPLTVALSAALIGLLGASSLAIADTGGSAMPAEPAPATEPAADATAAPATEGATPEEAAPAAPAEGAAAPAEGAAPTTP